MRLWSTIGHYRLTITVAEMPQQARFIEHSSHVANWIVTTADSQESHWQPWINKLNRNVITKFITIAVELPVIDAASVATYCTAINRLLHEIHVPVSRILLYLQLPEMLDRSLAILTVPDSMILADAQQYLQTQLQKLSVKIDHSSDTNTLAQTWCCYGMLQQIVAGLESLQRHTPLLQRRFAAKTQVVITSSAYLIHSESLVNYPRYHRKSWYQLAVCVLLLIGSLAYVMHANADYRSLSESITERAHVIQKLADENLHTVKSDVIASEIDALEHSKQKIKWYPLQSLHLQKHIDHAVQHVWEITIEPHFMQNIEHELTHLSVLHAAWYQYALVYIHLAKHTLSKNIIEFAAPVVGQAELELLAESQLQNTSLTFNQKILAQTMQTFFALPRWSRVYFLYQTKVKTPLPEVITRIQDVFPDDDEVYSGAMLQPLPQLTENEAQKLLQESYALDPDDLHQPSMSAATVNSMLQQAHIAFQKYQRESIYNNRIPYIDSIAQLRDYSMHLEKLWDLAAVSVADIQRYPVVLQQQYLVTVKKIQQMLHNITSTEEKSAMMQQRNTVAELRQFAMMTPKPLSNWMQQLLQTIERLLQQQNANTLRSDMRHSLHAISKQFPLMRNSKINAEQDALLKIFGEQGHLTQLLHDCDTPLSNSSEYCKLQPIVAEIRQALQSIKLRFTADYLAKDIVQCRLKINDDLIINDHGPQQMVTLLLSSFAENVVINLTIEYDHSPVEQRSYRGPWAIYRLIHDAHIEQTQQQQVRLSWGHDSKRCDFLLDSNLPLRLLRGTTFTDIATFIK